MAGARRVRWEREEDQLPVRGRAMVPAEAPPREAAGALSAACVASEVAGIVASSPVLPESTDSSSLGVASSLGSAEGVSSGSTDGSGSGVTVSSSAGADGSSEGLGDSDG